MTTQEQTVSHTHNCRHTSAPPCVSWLISSAEHFPSNGTPFWSPHPCSCLLAQLRPASKSCKPENRKEMHGACSHLPQHWAWTSSFRLTYASMFRVSCLLHSPSYDSGAILKRIKDAEFLITITPCENYIKSVVQKQFYSEHFSENQYGCS